MTPNNERKNEEEEKDGEVESEEGRCQRNVNFGKNSQNECLYSRQDHF